MPLTDLHQSFNAGELSPLLGSRSSIEKYAAGGSRMENFIPLPQGAMMKRAGSVFVANAFASISVFSALKGFNFQNGNYAVFEIVDGNTNIYVGAAAPTDSEVTPWTGEAVRQVQFSQINNTIYAAHGDSPPHLFIDATGGSFSAAEVDFSTTGNYPPLLDENTTDTTLTPSASSGSITLTASAAVFTTGNIGSYYEIAQMRTTAFAEVLLGDDATTAGTTLTFTGNPANNDTVTVNDGTARVFTFKTAGRTAVDEIAVEQDPNDTIDNLLLAVNTGGQGAQPEQYVIAEKLGGVKASATLGNTTGTNFNNLDTVTIGRVTYTMTTVTPIEASIYAYYVAIGATLDVSLNNLKAAINLDPGSNGYAPRGTTSGETTLKNPVAEGVSVTAAAPSGFILTVQALAEGAGGNEIAVTETSTVVAWSSAKLTGGTTVIRFNSRLSGNQGNSYQVTESSAAITGGGTMTGGGDESVQSGNISVAGKFIIKTTGTWRGTLTLQELGLDGITWNSVNSWVSKADYNVSFESEYLKVTTLRLSFVGAGDRQDLTWPRAIIEPSDPFHRSLYKVTAFTSATEVTADVIIAPIAGLGSRYWSESAWSARRGYPRAVCFHQNRLWFGGSAYEPFKVWASQLGDFLNFRFLETDDGAMAFQIASTELQNIYWMASARGLIIGTSTSEWAASEGDNQTVITPLDPPRFRQVSSFGSEYIQPVQADNTVIFVEKYGSTLRRMFYDEGSNGFVSSNLTVLAEHIPVRGIKAIALQKRPDAVIWAVIGETFDQSGPPFLACLTYDEEQNVYAWSRETCAAGETSCLWEAVACVDGPTSPVSEWPGQQVWKMGNMNGTRALCRVDTATLNRTLATALDAVHLDWATLDAGASATVAIPNFLAGLPVVIKYYDGTVTEVASATNPQAVTMGQSLQIGVAINSVFTTMRLDYQLQSGSTSGKSLRIVSETFRITQSRGGSIQHVLSNTQVTTQSLNVGALSTGEVRQDTGSGWYNDGKMTLLHDDPFPFLTTAIIFKTDVGDCPATPYLVADP